MSMHHTVREDGSAVAPLETVAGNGLLDRRALLGRGIALAGAVGTGVGTSLSSAAAEPLSNGPWSLAPGVPIPPYGQPSKFEQKVVRTLSNPEARAPRQRGAHATPSPQRHDHPEWPAFRDRPWRRNRGRPG